MELFRITRIKYLEDYTGRGGSFLNGARREASPLGRWNLPGIPVLYFASTPSVALLEMANYLPSPRLIPADYRLGIYHLPDNTKSCFHRTLKTCVKSQRAMPACSQKSEVRSQKGFSSV